MHQFFEILAIALGTELALASTFTIKPSLGWINGIKFCQTGFPVLNTVESIAHTRQVFV